MDDKQEFKFWFEKPQCRTIFFKAVKAPTKIIAKEKIIKRFKGEIKINLIR